MGLSCQNALSSFADVLDQYTEFKTTGYEATDHRLKVRIAKCKADLEAAIGAFKVYQQPVQTITRQDANAYRDSLLPCHGTELSGQI
jgi:cell fate (sporulation/competence/biofilm development) regulator YlbF (YheA/YmcA/DUF963 family)